MGKDRCVLLAMCMFVQRQCRCEYRNPEEGASSLGAEITNGSKLPDLSVGY